MLNACADLDLIAERMKLVKHKILVLSGKGGVGKSTFSAQLSYALASQGKEVRHTQRQARFARTPHAPGCAHGPAALLAFTGQVGLLDIDICGPSIPKMLGLEGQDIHQSNLGWSPVYVEDNLAVMSIGARATLAAPRAPAGVRSATAPCKARCLCPGLPRATPRAAGFMLPNPDEAVIWRGPR